MSLYTTYCKYLCLAAIAGLLVTGVPSQGNALDAAFSDILTAVEIESDAAAAGAPVCGDTKGTDCSPDGSVQKCQSKKGVKLCQTCTNGKWGSGYHGDCWDKKTDYSEAHDNTVLDRF